MRCLNCLTVCSECDEMCPTCKKPVAKRVHKRQWGVGTSKYAIIFMLIGQAIFHAFAPRWFPSRGQGINMQIVLWAGVVGAFSALIGAGLGMLMGGPSDARD